jgi:ribosomal protein L37AE/L43A
MTKVTIYDVDPAINHYAKTDHSYKALERLHKRISTGKRFAKAFPRYGLVSIQRGTGGGSYAHKQWGGRRFISLGDNRSDAVLLHEMAHQITFSHPRYKDEGHGPGFAAALLKLTGVVYGPQAAKSLKWAYWRLGIKVLNEKGQARRVVEPKGVDPAVIEKFAFVDREEERAVLRRAVFNAARQGETHYQCPECQCLGKITVARYARRYRPMTGVTWSCEPCKSFVAYERYGSPEKLGFVPARIAARN